MSPVFVYIFGARAIGLITTRSVLSLYALSIKFHYFKNDPGVYKILYPQGGGKKLKTQEEGKERKKERGWKSGRKRENKRGKKKGKKREGK